MDDSPVAKIQTDPIGAPVLGRLLVALGRLGPIELQEKKTSIHVVRGRAFLGIHPRKNALLINIVTRQPITSDRVVRHDQVSANRVHNHVLVRSEAEVDGELTAWIAQAYELTG